MLAFFFSGMISVLQFQQSLLREGGSSCGELSPCSPPSLLSARSRVQQSTTIHCVCPGEGGGQGAKKPCGVSRCLCYRQLSAGPWQVPVSGIVGLLAFFLRCVFTMECVCALQGAAGLVRGQEMRVWLS